MSDKDLVWPGLLRSSGLPSTATPSLTDTAESAHSARSLAFDTTGLPGPPDLSGNGRDANWGSIPGFLNDVNEPFGIVKNTLAFGWPVWWQLMDSSTPSSSFNFVDTPGSASLDITGKLTVEVWFGAILFFPVNFVVAQVWGGAGSRSWRLESRAADGGFIRFTKSHNGTDSQTVTTTETVFDTAEDIVDLLLTYLRVEYDPSTGDCEIFLGGLGTDNERATQIGETLNFATDRELFGTATQACEAPDPIDHPPVAISGVRISEDDVVVAYMQPGLSTDNGVTTVGAETGETWTCQRNTTDAGLFRAALANRPLGVMGGTARLQIPADTWNDGSGEFCVVVGLRYWGTGALNPGAAENVASRLDGVGPADEGWALIMTNAGVLGGIRVGGANFLASLLSPIPADGSLQWLAVGRDAADTIYVETSWGGGATGPVIAADPAPTVNMKVGYDVVTTFKADWEWLCDGYFGYTLTPAEMAQFVEENT